MDKNKILFEFKKIRKFFGRVLLFLLLLIISLLAYFNIPVSTENKNAKLGVTFSHLYASDIGLDHKEVYLKMFDELKIKKVRLPVYWSQVEKEKDQYDFSILDWQMEEAQKRDAEIILVVGQKVPRWPECFIPHWIDSNEERKIELLEIIEIVINRYKNNPAVKYWQVENEPFLPFGICPALNVDMLDAEIEIVKKLDSSRPIIVTDSGELSLWVRSAKRADIFGTTLYRTIYKEGLGYFDYPIGPRFFHFKYWLNKIIANQDKAIIVELQTEPWVSGYTTECPLDEQFKSMNAEKMRDNVQFARQVGFPEIYLWGVEWWYWLKVEKNNFELWETARDLFDSN